MWHGGAMGSVATSQTTHGLCGVSVNVNLTRLHLPLVEKLVNKEEL